MRIVNIFAENLFAFHYENEVFNEYERLMILWTDIEYLRTFAIRNNIKDRKLFVKNIRDDAEYIQDLMEEISNGKSKLEHFFRPLNDFETGERVLSLQKGKLKQCELRLYAVRIDNNLFVITGGAIKLQHIFKMDEHPDTQQEKVKMEKARDYLLENGVFNEDSFFELLNNNYDD